MKITPFLLVLVGCGLAFDVASARPTLARHRSTATVHRNVKQYYYLLPSRYFDFNNRAELLKRGFQPVVDLKNDYIHIEGDGDQSTIDMAVFRYRGHDTIAVSESGEDSYNSFHLLRYEKHSWKDVTEALSPVVSKQDLHFVIPRYGTTIKVCDLKGKIIAKLYWEKGTFGAEGFKG